MPKSIPASMSEEFEGLLKEPLHFKKSLPSRDMFLNRLHTSNRVYLDMLHAV